MQNTPSTIESIRQMIANDPAFKLVLPPAPKPSHWGRIGSLILTGAVALFALIPLVYFVFSKETLDKVGIHQTGESQWEFSSFLIFVMAVFAVWLIHDLTKDREYEAAVKSWEASCEQAAKEHSEKVKEEFERMMLIVRGMDPMTLAERERERDLQRDLYRYQYGHVEGADSEQQSKERDRQKDIEIARIQASLKQYEIDKNFEHLMEQSRQQAEQFEKKLRAENPSPEELAAATDRMFGISQSQIKWADQNLKGNERTAYKEMVRQVWERKT